MKPHECEEFGITKSCSNGHQGLNRSKAYGSYGSYGEDVEHVFKNLEPRVSRIK
ncbi:hypothetical protein BofuT4_uP122340.1 [Botrytis cinerea T4]|uniref:Uncharacterized protein n=1 Tax=Botryotinia fuckeliana (strain T4) TaxID=999810 RepID=G2YNL7_BOTF4|nr:hypothetical protein BofuT4_uP122340.1 [Botrytis cinerea T4]